MHDHLPSLDNWIIDAPIKVDQALSIIEGRDIFWKQMDLISVAFNVRHICERPITPILMGGSPFYRPLP